MTKCMLVVSQESSEAFSGCERGTGALPVYAYADLSVSRRSGEGGDMHQGPANAPFQLRSDESAARREPMF